MDDFGVRGNQEAPGWGSVGDRQRRRACQPRIVLFEVINARYLKGSIITTSHVGIASWAERLGDPMLAAALDNRSTRTVASSSPSTALLPDARPPGQCRHTPQSRRNPGRRHPVTAEQRACPACGAEFTWTPASPRQRFCSTRCRQSSWWDRRRRQATAALRCGGVPLADGDRGDGRHAGDHDAHGTAAPVGTGTLTASLDCPHCRQPVRIVAWLVPPAAASVATPPRHADTIRDSQ